MDDSRSSQAAGSREPLIRLATLEDAEAILEVANAHELRVDKSFEPYPLSEMKEQISGFVEPGMPFVLERDGIKVVAFLQTYTPRKLVELDLFSIGSPEETSQLFEHALTWAHQNRKGFKLRTAANRLDTELLDLFEDQKLQYYRDYYKLVNYSIAAEFPDLPGWVEIRPVDLDSHSELLHKLESESFASHFGYSQIDHDSWLKERRADNTADHTGSFVLFYESEPAGFLLSSDARADVQGGWVDKLGVLENYRGKGFGRLLLAWGTAHAAQKGYRTIGLGADTGNESGALELYFSSGFEVALSWRAYQLPSLG